MLKFNLTESGLFSVFPWLTMAFSANLGGWIADTLVSRGVSVTVVRKVHVMQLENYKFDMHVIYTHHGGKTVSRFHCLPCLMSCADHADNWIFRPSFFLNSVEPY